MTSLQLKSDDTINRDSKPEWGTGKVKEHVPLWTPKPPTWHYSGKPIQQYYGLTQLKKSNVRWNDQLMPKPQESNIADQMIHKDFPAEHPYSSHIPKLKVFPSFAMTSEDPKRGVEARNSLPLTSETPAAAYDVLILQKTKGKPLRHEFQAAPPDSLKRGLSWHGYDGYSQGVKVCGDKKEYYPIPPTTVIPNLMDRQGTDLAMSDAAANSTRNLERQQWKTTYDRNHTGIGPVNQYKLNNLDDKRAYTSVTGQEDDDIYPWFTNTFEKSRPQEGRISQAQNKNFGISPLRGAAASDSTDFRRKATLTEREEHRLLNGKEYANLPPPGAHEKHETDQWNEVNKMIHPDERFTALVEKQIREAPNPLPFIERGTKPVDDDKSTYLDKLAKEREEYVQQIEAQNRWKQLELMKPAYDIGTLERKLAISTPKEQVATFYGHEGRYNEERAGLYNTSYDPAKLAYKLEDDPGKLGMRQTVGSHSNAVHFPTDLNTDMDILRLETQTDMRKVPMFSERPDVFEVFEPFKRDRYILKTQLQPNDTNARERVQEGEVVLKDSTMGDSYNTKKFLQEYQLPSNVRSEPLALMSSQNQNLANVRVNASRRVQFDNHITVGEGAGNSPLLVSRANINSPKVTLYSPRAPTPRTARPAPDVLTVENDISASMVRSSEAFRPVTASLPKQASMSAMPDHSYGPTDTEKLFLSQKGRMVANNQFKSRATNITPGFAADNMFKPLPSTELPQVQVSEDPRYSWEPGCGLPRPQTSLIKLQNSFSKSDAYKRLKEQFPEKNPNLIDNIDKGRQHEFMSLNAQVLRGTLISA